MIWQFFLLAAVVVAIAFVVSTGGARSMGERRSGGLGASWA